MGSIPLQPTKYGIPGVTLRPPPQMLYHGTSHIANYGETSCNIPLFQQIPYMDLNSVQTSGHLRVSCCCMCMHAYCGLSIIYHHTVNNTVFTDSKVMVMETQLQDGRRSRSTETTSCRFNVEPIHLKAGHSRDLAAQTVAS